MQRRQRCGRQRLGVSRRMRRHGPDREDGDGCSRRGRARAQKLRQRSQGGRGGVGGARGAHRAERDDGRQRGNRDGKLRLTARRRSRRPAASSAGRRGCGSQRSRSRCCYRCLLLLLLLLQSVRVHDPAQRRLHLQLDVLLCVHCLQQRGPRAVVDPEVDELPVLEEAKQLVQAAEVRVQEAPDRGEAEVEGGRAPPGLHHPVPVVLVLLRRPSQSGAAQPGGRDGARASSGSGSAGRRRRARGGGRARA